jgi:hypothetical protein
MILGKFAASPVISMLPSISCATADAPTHSVWERWRASRLPSLRSALRGLDRHHALPRPAIYLNVTDEELRKGLEVSWGRQLRVVSGQ